MTSSHSSSPKPSSISLPKVTTRLDGLPAYIFAQLNKIKAQARANGLDLIDLGMGNPDRPTPQPIVEAIAKAVQNPENHGYPDFEGKKRFPRIGSSLDATTLQRHCGSGISDFSPSSEQKKDWLT